MPKEEKAADSRQSVDLKWKERKGLEENGTLAIESHIPSVSHHLVFSAEDFYACADLLTTAKHSAALTLSTLPALLKAPLAVSGAYNFSGGANAWPVVSVRNESGVLYFTYLSFSSGEAQPTSIGVPSISGLTMTDSVSANVSAKEAPAWDEEEEE